MNKTDYAVPDLMPSARKVVVDCCGLAPGEKVVILSDSAASPTVARALFEAAREAGGSVTIVVTEPLARPGSDLPATAAASLDHADVILAPTSKSAFFCDSIQRACRQEPRARFVALSECDESTFVEGGLRADFRALEPLALRLQGRVSEAHEMTLATPAGTSIKASIAGREGYSVSGVCETPGRMIGIPTVEVWVAPVEPTVEGTIVVDASVSGGIGLVGDEPIQLRVEKGRVVEFGSGRHDRALEALLADAGDDSVYQVAELAFGLNPYCRITGNVIEDEGRYGTCHIAVGKNTVFGGANDAPIHIDMVQHAATVHLDGEPILINGELVAAGAEGLTTGLEVVP